MRPGVEDALSVHTVIPVELDLLEAGAVEARQTFRCCNPQRAIVCFVQRLNAPIRKPLLHAVGREPPAVITVYAILCAYPQESRSILVQALDFEAPQPGFPAKGPESIVLRARKGGEGEQYCKCTQPRRIPHRSEEHTS